MSLARQTQIGLREMPANAAWLLSRMLKPAEQVGEAAESATAGARDRGRKLGAAVIDAAPGGGDSVEIRMRRAHEAGVRARAAEDEAVAAAEESKACAAHARETSERGRTRLKAVQRETERQVKQRVAEAQKSAEEAVRREQLAADAAAEDERQQAKAEVEEELEDAQRAAEEAQQHAEELVQEAAERLAEAQRLAAEAAGAAREVAEAAHRQAEQLADEAQQQASDADAQVRAAEQLRERSEATARHTAKQLQRKQTNGDLGSYPKPALVELAASIGIEKRTTMTKSQLVDAISRAERDAG
jgi:DNA repair exonuclease SbcCD ATPase subunit